MDSDEEYIAPNGRDEVDVDMDDMMSSEDEGRPRRKKTKSTKSKNGTDKSKLNTGAYSWEDEYQRSWDVVKDDQEGRSLDSIIQTMIESRKKKIMKLSSVPFQRGIIRTVVVVIDASSVMLEKDLRPTRFGMMLTLLTEFITEFFDQNPISQLGIVMMRNGIAYLVSEVSGSPQIHLEKVRQLKLRQHNKFEPKGDPSLQNALEMSRSLLKISFGDNNRNSKEILVIWGALFTSDPGDIHKTIDNLVKDQIKVRVIGLSAQVAICQELVNRTNHVSAKSTSGTMGNYGVIMNESHFRELLMNCVVPLPVTDEMVQAQNSSNNGVPLIKMGFPSAVRPTPATLGLPQLFANSAEDESNDISGQDFQQENNSSIGYTCPQCKNKVSHLPTVCPICGLMLILSTHLARSYHHLVPLVEFKDVPVATSYSSSHCYGCLLQFPEGSTADSTGKLEQLTSSRYQCIRCQNHFCIDCDVFIHETLHNCPGCENLHTNET